MNTIKSIAVIVFASIMLAGCGGSDEPPQTSITVKTATVAPPFNSTIYGDSTVEVGRFALSAENDAKLKKVALSATGTLTSLTDVVGLGSLTLWNVATGERIAVATTTVSGKTVVFEGMSYGISKDMTSNLKVVLTTIGDLSPNYSKTLQLTIVSIETDAPSSMVGLPIVMKQYRVGVTPPTVSLVGKSLTSNGVLATISFTNIDRDASLRLDMATFVARFLAGLTVPAFTGAICLREIGSANGCQGGTPASTISSGGTVSVSLAGRSDASNTLAKDGGTLELEVYLEGGPIWVAGDAIQLELQSMRVVDASGTATTHDYLRSVLLSK